MVRTRYVKKGKRGTATTTKQKQHFLFHFVSRQTLSKNGFEERTPMLLLWLEFDLCHSHGCCRVCTGEVELVGMRKGMWHSIQKRAVRLRASQL